MRLRKACTSVHSVEQEQGVLHARLAAFVLVHRAAVGTRITMALTPARTTAITGATPTRMTPPKMRAAVVGNPAIG